MATKGITVTKPPFMTDTEWHYFKLEYKEYMWGREAQVNSAHIFHDGWEACSHDESRRSKGEELPES